MTPESRTLDPDFSREVLEELYAYRRKRLRVAWILWGTLGWFGAHRFYLQREFTGVAMLLTGGGGLLWWMADAFFIRHMVETHNERQETRERTGLPPVEMDFMPPLRREVLQNPPSWLATWEERRPWRRRLRLAGDVLVLVVAGSTLGALSGMEGALEAIVAVVLLSVLTTLGAGPDWLDDVPVFATLERWAHRLRLFYYHNEPGSPPGLLLRSFLGMIWAPFRAKDRAEVKLYMELGAAFTAAFLLVDLVGEVLVPALSGGALSPGGLVVDWLREALATFFLTYAFAAPVGAVLTLYLLVRPTHRVPRILAGVTLAAMAAGAL